MFWVRLGSGIVLLAIIVSSVLFGTHSLFAFSLIVSLIGLFEFLRLRNIQKSSIAILAYIGSVFYCVDYSYFNSKYISSIFISLFILGATLYIINYNNIKIDDIIYVTFSFFYVVVMFSFLFRIMKIDNILIWLVFISAWGSDTMAYLVGMLIGKHKLTPILSPKKTVEGAVGGVIGAVLISYIFIYLIERFNYGNMTVYTSNIYIVVSFVVFFASIFSQIGDLFASSFKRHYGIKDFGKLIPGHGGILDRFDSILFTAPVVYLILTIFLKLG